MASPVTVRGVTILWPTTGDTGYSNNALQLQQLLASAVLPINGLYNTTTGLVGNLALDDFGNLTVNGAQIVPGPGSSGYSGFSGFSGFSGYSGLGLSGFSGRSGYSGFSGRSGYSGTNGSIGVSGWSGTSGMIGTSGWSGISGASTSGWSGTSGISGKSGWSGTSGVSGYSGTSGKSGWSGTIGVSGYSGIAGASTSGWSGTSGVSGWSGTSGKSGYSGITGSNGTSGYSGTTGSNGTSGYSGSIGATGTSGYSGAQGSLSPWVVITSNTLAVNQHQYIANTNGGTFTVTLPATPALGNIVAISDGGAFAANNLIVDGNGNTFDGIAGNLIIDISNVLVYFTYDGITWRVVATAGPSGLSGYSGVSGHSGIGLSGTSGYSGISGTSGASTSGYSGSIGTEGTSGYSGLSGATGTGTSGYSGISGASTSGYSGISGASTSGYSGTIGTSGTSGYSGVSGISGYGGSAGRIYYPENSVASDITGYKVASVAPSGNAQSNIAVTLDTGGIPTFMGSFATSSTQPNVTSLPAGTALRYIYAWTSSGTVAVRTDLFRYNTAGNEATSGARTDISFNLGALTITRITGSFITDGFTQGARITVSGSTGGLNDGNWTIQTVSALIITLIQGSLLTTQIAGPAITITTKEKLLRTGNTPTFTNTTVQLQEVTYSDPTAYPFALADRIIFKWWGIRSAGNPTMTIATEGVVNQSYIVTTITAGAQGISGYSGFSGISGASTSGYSGISGASTSGYSGISGAAGGITTGKSIAMAMIFGF